MGLFSPWFLAGLAALALPVWLHLLRQFKQTPRPFSSLMFFEKQIQSSSKHRRLRYFALLVMRMAFLLLLAFLFANPFINRAASAIAIRKLTVIVVDRTFSMRYGNRFADAKAQATRFSHSASGIPVVVIAMASQSVAVNQPVSDRAAIDSAIAAIEPSDETSSYGEFSRAIRIMQQTLGVSLDVHLFTDAQQTSMPSAFTDLQLGPNTALTVHEIGEGQSPNWAVESVHVPSGIYDSSNISLTAGISGWQSKISTRKISVILDGRTIAAKEVTVPASGRAEAIFDNLTIPYGSHRGKVILEPHDDLSNDDTFLFSINRSDPRKVLFLHGTPRLTEALFYKSALDSYPATGLRVRPELINNASTLDLSVYPVIVLNNPGEIDQQTIQHLTDYVTSGGALFIALGPDTMRTGVIPIAGNRVVATTVTQAAGKISSEMFAPGTFENVQFLATPRVTPGPADHVMVSFANEWPLLFQRALGEGKLLIFCSTLDNSTSDFPVHGSFLPFVSATASYLDGGGDHAASNIVGNAVALRQSKMQTASADVVGPDGAHEFPLSDATRIMSFNPHREGFYDVHSASGKQTLLAVNANRRESNLTKVPAETLILWRNTGNGSVAQSERTSSPVSVPFSLWRYVLCLLLIAALVESIFATRYLSEERRAT